MLTYLSLSCPNIESLICLWMTCLLYDCSCPEQYFCCQALIQNCLLAGIVFVTRQHQPHKQLCQRITGNCCHFSFSRFKILSNCFLFFFFFLYSYPCFITLSPAYFFSWDQHNSFMFYFPVTLQIYEIISYYDKSKKPRRYQSTLKTPCPCQQL